VVTECLSIREARRQHEVVRDPVEHSLNDENFMIDKIRSILRTRCEDSWDKLAVLEDIRQRLEIDLQVCAVSCNHLFVNNYDSTFFGQSQSTARSYSTYKVLC
jgi:hypothetical protein